MIHGLVNDRPPAPGGVLCCPQRKRRRVNAGGWGVSDPSLLIAVSDQRTTSVLRLHAGLRPASALTTSARRAEVSERATYPRIVATHA